MHFSENTVSAGIPLEILFTFTSLHLIQSDDFNDYVGVEIRNHQISVILWNGGSVCLTYQPLSQVYKTNNKIHNDHAHFDIP